MFDVLLRELATRFGLGEKARELLGALLALIFDPASGGFNGFVNRMKAAGLGPVVNSWLGRGENHPVTSAGVLSAFGAELLDQLAAKAGFTRERTASALTALLPGVLDKLTPDAVLPKAGAVPANVVGYLAGQEAFAASVRGLWPQAQLEKTVELALPTPAPAPTPAAASPAHAAHAAHAAHGHAYETEHATHDDHAPATDGGMGGRWVAWAALLLIAVSGWLWFGHSALEQEIVVPELPQTAPVSTPVTMPATEASLRLRFLQGSFDITGTLSSAAQRDQLLAAATAAAGKQPTADLAVNDKLPAAAWLGALEQTLPQLAVDGLEMEFSGNLVELIAMPPGSDPAGLAQLAQRFPDLRPTGLFDPAARAFLALPGDPLSTADLVAALNLMRLHFESGSHILRADSRRLLRRAAAVIRRAPVDSLIEVGGHTDNRGVALDNQNLSEARAFAVVEALVESGVPYERLLGRGYGASRPLASNDDSAGRAQNRRIEFTVLR